MSIFNEFFKKEKPVFTGIARGAGGFGFGAAGDAASGEVSITGGTKTTNGSYTVHTFLSSGSLVVSNTTQPDVQYLIVGGGGGGGMGGFTGGAGGGGGGLRTSVPGKTPGGPGASTESVLILPAGSYTITVGAGGGIVQNPVASPPQDPASGKAGSRGGDSSIVGGSVNLIAYGGGGGGGYSTVGQNGASGGGGGANDSGTQTGGNRNRDGSGNPTPNQGYNGGTALIGGPQNYAGGGGGGAGGSGTQSNPGSADAHCDGGPGLPNNIDGNDYWYAGGGGGTGYTKEGGAGGKGGGGGGNCCASDSPIPNPSGGGSARSNGQNGGADSGGPNGAGKNAGKGGANTGGGGGGVQEGAPYFATPPATGNDAGHGGSGIVIIRYPT